MNNINVSFSALETYEQCSEKYRLRYEERIVSEKIPSPLFFGSAIDSAVELFLLQKKKILSDRELDLLLNENAYSMFDKCMSEQNGILLEKNPDCEYFYSDFEPSILKAEDLTKLSKLYPNIQDFFEFFNKCKIKLKEKEDLSKNSKILFNHLCWMSLYRKGELLLKAYEESILPEIEEVFDIQKEIELLNESGDRLRGKIDFIASFKDHPDIIYICDNKTSSEAYRDDSVSNSTQLSIYSEAENSSNACYVVLQKKIRIKEPRVRTQIIKDIVSEEQKQKTFDFVESKLNNIACGEFSKKDSPKECHFFGKKCPYYLYCWNNKDMTGLYKK